MRIYRLGMGFVKKKLGDRPGVSMCAVDRAGRPEKPVRGWTARLAADRTRNDGLEESRDRVLHRLGLESFFGSEIDRGQALFMRSPAGGVAVRRR